MTNVLEGIRVVEAANFIAGPAAGAIMADFGAEVIHIEPPEVGDPYRYIYKIHPLPECEQNYPWFLDNRGKRSLALDLKTEAGQQVLHRLIGTADVFVTNYLPSVVARLRLRYEDLTPSNARLIYAHASGYGETGPDAERPGYDVTAWWARSGIADATRALGAEVATMACGVGDHSTSVALFSAIMMALYRRERTGKGSKVSTSLMANGVWSNSILAQADLCGGKPFELSTHAASPNALISAYRTKDDRYLYLVVVRGDLEWPRLCQAIGRPDLTDDLRFAELGPREENHRELVALLDEVFAKKSMAEWTELLEGAGITFGLVQHAGELRDDPQMRANEIFRTVERGDGLEIVDSPIQIEGVAKATPTRAPELGEHTREVLAALGYSAAQIQTLITSGAASAFEG